MARPRGAGAVANDTDASMHDVSDDGKNANEPVVCAVNIFDAARDHAFASHATARNSWVFIMGLYADSDQEVDETPDYTDSEDPNTTASSVVGETADGRKRRAEANQLRRSIFGKKHDKLGESKVSIRAAYHCAEPIFSLCYDLT